jgi:hypothetical protein
MAVLKALAAELSSPSLSFAKRQCKNTDPKENDPRWAIPNVRFGEVA